MTPKQKVMTPKQKVMIPKQKPCFEPKRNNSETNICDFKTKCYDPETIIPKQNVLKLCDDVMMI